MASGARLQPIHDEGALVSDRLTGLFGLVLALVYGTVGARYETGLMTDPLGPNVFPVLVAGLLGTCGVLLMARPRDEASWPAASVWARTLAAIVSMVVYGLVLETLGFVLASFLLVAILVRLMASVLLYALFDRLLGLPLPSGTILGGVLGS